MVSKTVVAADIAKVRELHKKFESLVDAGDEAAARKVIQQAADIVEKDPAAMAGAQ